MPEPADVPHEGDSPPTPVLPLTYRPPRDELLPPTSTSVFAAVVSTIIGTGCLFAALGLLFVTVANLRRLERDWPFRLMVGTVCVLLSLAGCFASFLTTRLYLRPRKASGTEQ